MAINATEAKKMLDAARATGRKLSIGYQWRKHPAARYAKEYIKTGAIGEIYHADARCLRRRGTPNWGVFLNEEEQGGGPIIDIATHVLDLTLYLMDNYEPRVVLGKKQKKMEHPEAGNIWGDNGVSTSKLEDSADAMIIMKNGATIMLETSWAINLDLKNEMESLLAGTKGGLEFRDGSLRLNSVQLNRKTQTDVDLSAGGVAFYDGADVSGPVFEMLDWIDSIVNDHDPIVLPEQAYVVSQILEAIYTSDRTGEPVFFD